MYIGEEGANKLKDQAGKFIPLLNNMINSMKKEQLYAEIFQIGIKYNKYTVKKSLKDLLKVEM